MKYYKIYRMYLDKLNKLGNTFTAKEAKSIGLDQYILTKMRHRGFLKRVQVGDGVFEWRRR